jgi:putative Flp pilus-assembly TadE/G-like protein
MKRLRNEQRGQAIVITIVSLTALIGFVGFTVDIGSWYRAHRQAQQTADAAALAGAQALPGDADRATVLAQQYADKNGSGVDPGGITFPANNVVAVKVTHTAPGFFANLFGIDSVDVHANAAARTGVPIAVDGAAPIVVSKYNPMLSGPGCPCFQQETTLPLSDIGAPGGYGLINLAPDQQNVGQSDLANWVQYGLNSYLGLGHYVQETGTKFNGNATGDALTARLNTDLLFPVFDTLLGPGTNAQYNIIGWVAFHLDSFEKDNGNHWKLHGYFDSVIWDGIQSSSNSNNPPDFGVHTIALVN